MELDPKARMARRTFLRTASVGAAGALAWGAAGCTGNGGVPTGHEGMWKQASGTTINFISENTAPTSAIAANLEPFKELTGIDVRIAQLVLTSVEQKVALDLGARSGEYAVIYADPYIIMPALHNGFADLREFIADDTLPSVPKGLDDFIPTQLLAAGRFQDKLLALPYDCPTLIWCYRKDLFDKYHDRMQEDLGFDPTPSINITWEQYYRIAVWFNNNADDVPYGTGHQAKQFTSLKDDFADVLWAYGADFFSNGDHIARYGSTDPGPSIVDRPEAVEAAAFYKKLVGVAHPGSLSWDWNDLAEAFGSGEIAMCPEWHEDAAGWWVPGGLEGKVGFSPLPTGPVRSANDYGGTGLAINRYASKKEQIAAWLFLVWATMPATQRAGLFSSVGGGTPTRESVYAMPSVQKATHPPTKAPNALTFDAVKQAWKPENIGLRPKIPQWNQCDVVICSELSSMLTAGKSPQATMRDMKKGIDQATRGADSAV